MLVLSLPPSIGLGYPNPCTSRKNGILASCVGQNTVSPAQFRQFRRWTAGGRARGLARIPFFGVHDLCTSRLVVTDLCASRLVEVLLQEDAVRECVFGPLRVSLNCRAQVLLGEGESFTAVVTPAFETIVKPAF
jgi:hypothetical protein